MTADACPPRDVLETLAVGGTAAPGVEAHLVWCESCRTVLERIGEDNRFLSGYLRGAGPRAVPPPSSLIEIPGYDLLGEIHRGGQGVVYHALQRATRREVAIKVMKHGPFATLSDRARFDREIDTLAGLNHPNIVAVHDAGVAAGFQYFVMNYIDGRPLDEAALEMPLRAAEERAAHPGARRAPLLEVFIKVCEAVQAAHLRGIIHRDLKPSNIRVDRHGEPHILDFGLAKSTAAEPDSAMTRTGQFVGSLPWASPEQVEGELAKIDLRTDVYSLGAILFQLLTGRLPFDVGTNLRRAVETILYAEPPRPSAHNTAAGGPPIDDDLDTLVLKCLAKDRERRYQTAGELARDLRRYLQGEAIEAKRDSAVYMLRKTLYRYRLHATIATAFVVLVAVFGAVMAVLYRQSEGLKHAAVRTADSLNSLLSQSNVEQGRMAGMLGNMEQAEQLLWGELLAHRELSGPRALHLNLPPGAPEAYWGIWELYRRFPCRRTLVHQPRALRTATVAADGESFWTIDGRGSAARLDGLGHPVDGFTLALPVSRNLPAVHSRGELVLHHDGRRHALWYRNTPDTPILTLPGDALSVSLSSSGRRLAALVDGAAVVWDTNEVAELVRFTAAEGSLWALAISEDDRWLAARDQVGGIVVWDIASRDCVRRAPGVVPRAIHAVGELRFSSDGRWLADAWLENAGRVWDLDADPPVAVELAERPGDYRVQRFSPDGRLLAVGDLRGAVRLFDAGSGHCRRTFVAHRGRVRDLAFTPDGQNLWTCGESDLRLWETEADRGVRCVAIAGEALHAVDLHPTGGWLYAGGALGCLQRVAGDACVATAVDFGGSATISSIGFAPGGLRVAVGTHGNLALLWDNAEARGAPLRLAHPRGVGFVQFASDGVLLATACDDGVVRLWDADGRLARESPPAGDRIPEIAFDRPGARLAIAVRSGALRVWDLGTSSYELWKEPTHVPLRTVCFTPDGRWLLAAGAERVIEIWDVAGRAPVAELVGHTQEVFCLDVCPTGDLVASGDAGGVVRLWHAGLRRLLAVLEGHGAPVMALHFSSAGRQLVSASLDGTVRTWDLGYYAQHIAGNLEAQLQRLEAAADPAGVAAWRDWAAHVSAGDALPAVGPP